MNAIVVVDKNWAIGREGGLLFSLPTDMKRFRSLTLDGTVILGRKTLDSFPGGRPLPRRRNIVITRNVDFDREGSEIVASPQAAVELAAGTEDDKLWVIGGGSVYREMLPYCDRAYVTRVHATPESDTFFPNLDRDSQWYLAETLQSGIENGISYEMLLYKRK